MEEVKTLTSERDVQKANVANAMKMLDEQRAQAEKLRAEAQQRHAEDMARVKDAYDKQLAQVKSASDKQIETLKEMNKKQVEDQMALIREQMRTTSETVLKERQEELGKKNMEQVSKIVDPLQQSLKMMREALDDSKEKHQEALHKLDATIQANMKNSADLGETAARLTRALTGEVKVQGNFGELKLKQLLEDLGLKDGEQFSSQEHLRDSLGKAIKDDEGKGLIPDFVLHFPNNRDVVVDSKMSFTAYERYINSEDPMEQTQCLKEHLISVRAQVDRLAKKDYSKYLKEGYNKLNFVIMYIHTEGALNLALLNDGSLWREAYDKGVLILGPQTMYMNLRILELMWTQVRQLNNQEEMMKAANMIISRTQDFAIRFAEVESRMRDTVKSIDKLKITTSESGASIITAAKNLIKAGGREDKKKKGLDDPAASMFLDSDAKWTDD
ncbi:MAG: DNA recombination protein RmuC [Bacteroidaceae bacterium]|nr:DNA recombination protein RmuC [Bacteroidaceae bacterium]